MRQWFISFDSEASNPRELGQKQCHSGFIHLNIILNSFSSCFAAVGAAPCILGVVLGATEPHLLS
jgi:hypothetical protein